MTDFKVSFESKLIILTAVLASLLEIIDTSIVNVAVPTMMGNLGATLEDISWVVTGYIIANAIVLPLSGWLGLQFGRREYYTTCILIFTGTSVACGFAPNLNTLVIFRVFQGLAGGALLPTSQSLIQEQFPKEKAGMASAIYGMSVMIGPTLGPTLGGYLTDHFGWRSIFNINLPLGLFAALMASIYVTNPVKVVHKTAKPKIDVIGLLLLIIGVGCLQFVLERGQADEWFDSRAITLCSILAAISIPSFIVWELRIPNPIINLHLFKDIVVRSGTVMMMMLGMMLYGLVFILPVFMGRILHFDATQTGMMFIPGALLTALCMPMIGALLRKNDARILILFGMIMIETMLMMMTHFSPQTGARDIFWALVVRGLGMGFLFVPINSVVLGQFRGPELAQVAGLMNLFRQLGGSVGIAIIGTLLERNFHQNYAELANHVSWLSAPVQPYLIQAQHSLARRFPEMVGFRPQAEAILETFRLRIEQQVFVMSFTQMMWVIALAYACSIVPLYFMKSKTKAVGPVDLH